MASLEGHLSLNDMIISQINDCRELMNHGKYQEGFNSIIMLDALMSEETAKLEGQKKKEHETLKDDIEQGRRISNDRAFKMRIKQHLHLFVFLVDLAIKSKIMKNTRAAFT